MLANRRPPCPVQGCPGRVTFKDHTRVFARSLDTIPVHDPEDWAWEDRRRAELTVLGYRLELGKWVAPEPKEAAPAGRDRLPDGNRSARLK